MSKKLRALAVAIALIITSFFIGGASTASAVGNCSRGGQYYVGGTYAMIDCFSDAGNTSPYVYQNGIRITITCKYVLFGVAHTYNVYGNWAYWAYYSPATSYPGAPGTTGWSSAACSYHGQDSSGWANPVQDHIIHATPQTTPSPSYWGYPYAF